MGGEVGPQCLVAGDDDVGGVAHCAARSRGLPRTTVTRGSGAQSAHCARHCDTSPAGTTSSALSAWRRSSSNRNAASACTVLPTPMSSASKSAGRESRAWTPSIW
ncbi:MAG: hypothetical protein U0531_17320 [Dehalococcoidia bacterium]